MQSEKLTGWVKQREEEYLAQGRALSADSRGDEASLMRVRGNICGVFAALARTADKDALRQPGEDTKAALLRLTEKTSAPWKQRLETARAHDDMVTAAVEQVKIETMDTLLGEWKHKEEAQP